MYEFDFTIPNKFINAIKSRVLSTWFKTDEPLLTHHKAEKRFGWFTFKCDYCEDVDLMGSILCDVLNAR